MSRPVRGQSAEIWPRFQHDDANTGYAPENTGPVSNVEQLWAVETGDEVWSSPAVAGGTVYIGSLDGNVYALDAVDGTEQWTFRTDGAVGSSPTVAESTVVSEGWTVYIGSRQVYALNAEDGTEQWSFETGASIASSPVVADGTVYVGSNDNTVYALDAADGGVQWTFETGGSVQSSPAVMDGTVYVGSNDNTVYALDAADGDVQWAFETGGSVQSSPAVMDGTVYVGSWDTNVYAVDAAEGTERWRFETGADVDVSSSPAVVDETVYVGGGGSNNVYALNADDGTEQWRWETGEVYSSPAVVNGTVYIGSYDGDVYALDASVGPDAELNPNRELWATGTDDEVFSSPAVVDGTVYVGSKDSSIYAFAGEASPSAATAPAGNEPNEPPTAAIAVTPSSPEPGESVTFDATESTDVDGSITSYEWEIAVEADGGGGGRSASGPTVDASIPSDGGAVGAELTVTDDDGATDTAERTVSSDGAGAETTGNGTESVGALPLLVGAGTLGAAGGVWWYSHKSSTDTDSGKSGDGSAGGTAGSTSTGAASSSGSADAPSSSQERSSAGRGSTPPSTGPGTLSGADTEPSADAERLARIDELLDEGETLRGEAGTYRDAGEYDRALEAYDGAQQAYDEALETASESDALDTEEIERTLAAVQDERRDVLRRRLGDEVETLRSELDHADSLADSGDIEQARERLADLGSRLASAKDSVTRHGLGELHDTVVALERRRTERLDELPERRNAHPIPDDIPRAPTLSVDYDALTEGEPIGGGGNADVTKATLATPTGNVTLAIKRPRMAGTLHTDAVERMLEEAETWDKLDDHDHVVGVVDYGSKPIPWIAMEYMDAGHLGDRSGQMDPPQALWTAIATTKGVRHAHRRGVAHLDLKPENVLFRTVEDAWDVPKVADWGLSKHLLDHSKSVDGLSTHYAAPEQFDENGTADDITDIYQLGAVFYELFTGRPPFEGQPFAVIEQIKNSRPTPPSALADVPDALDEILLTALAKDRSDRYENIVLLRNALQGVFDEQ